MREDAALVVLAAGGVTTCASSLATTGWLKQRMPSCGPFWRTASHTDAHNGFTSLGSFVLWSEHHGRDLLLACVLLAKTLDGAPNPILAMVAAAWVAGSVRAWRLLGSLLAPWGAGLLLVFGLWGMRPSGVLSRPSWG